jgi:molybdate transport system ATP-binding protein
MLTEMEEYVIRIENADVVLGGKKVLRRISWELKPGEHWAVLGRNGSGKSTFLKLLTGEVRQTPDGGRLTYRLKGDEQEAPLGVREYMASVTPELQDAYVRNCWDMSGEEIIHTGFFHSIWLHEKPRRELCDAAEGLMKRLGIAGLRDKSILAMSRGEARKVLIARALAARPAILLLDEICDGVDASSRENILALLEEIAKSGTQIVYATHRTEEVIPSVTHVIRLRQGRIYSIGRPEGASPVLHSARTKGCESRGGVQAALKVPASHRGWQRNVLFRIEQATVYLDDGRVLDNVNWRVNAGENWAVLGRNGSGKSTLLRLIYGEVHAALGGKIEWFGRTGTRNIWDVRKRIGYVSAELQSLYDDDLTGEEVVLSGLFSSRGLYRKVTGKQRKMMKELMASLSIVKLGGKKVGRMSYGEMRKLLIARAAINGPALLLLDEPCNGLDRNSREDFLNFMEMVARSGTAIVMAVHHYDELIPSITHILLMDKGRSACQGKKEEVPYRSLLTSATQPAILTTKVGNNEGNHPETRRTRPFRV